MEDHSGMNSRDTRSDAASEMHSGMASWPMKKRSMPSWAMRTDGRKTTMVVSVDMTMARLTSPAPLTAASTAPMRSSFCRRVMFSTTTTELSTSMPTESMSPIIEMMFRDWPAKYMTTMVMSRASGMASVMRRVSRILRRK